MRVDMKMARASSVQYDRLPIPVNPVIYATLRSIYASALKEPWTADVYGRPHFRHESKDGHILIFSDVPPDAEGTAYPRRLYLIPRQRFISAGRQRAALQALSVETADVFLILMKKIAGLSDPSRDIARIRVDEIAEHRGVRVRHGSTRNLHERLKQEVLKLADLRLRMSWRDYRKGGTLYIGRERPDRLLDIVDVEYRNGKSEQAYFHYRCGRAISHFLDPEGLRWVGYYSRPLLNLSPYHDVLTKKLGTYWIFLGVAAGKKGKKPRATPRTILDFIGETVNWRYPGKTVDAFHACHEKLTDLGVLEEFSDIEPPNRGKGYFERWLDTTLTVKLSDSLWRITEKRRTRKTSPSRRLNPARQNQAFRIPDTLSDLQENPRIISEFRTTRYLRQEELARLAGVSRQTLSKYERGLQKIPEKSARTILRVMKERFRP
jgi:DNA-binding transcriptional regulator YiaG